MDVRQDCMQVPYVYILNYVFYDARCQFVAFTPHFPLLLAVGGARSAVPGLAPLEVHTYCHRGGVVPDAAAPAIPQFNLKKETLPWLLILCFFPAG